MSSPSKPVKVFHFHVRTSLYLSRIVLDCFWCLALASVGAVKDRSVSLAIKSPSLVILFTSGGKKDSPEAPASNVRLATMLTPDDLVAQAHDALAVVQIIGPDGVEVLDLEQPAGAFGAVAQAPRLQWVEFAGERAVGRVAGLSDDVQGQGPLGQSGPCL